MSDTKNQSKVDGLTIVRFFAALGVFFDHYGAELLKNAPFPIRNLLDRGSAGVLLFFILSGFLLVMVYAPRHPDGKVNKKKFFVARFARVYPAYLLALVLAIPFMMLWVKSVGWGPNLNLPLFIASKFSMTDYWYSRAFEPDTSASWLQQGWSLTCEGIFYILFPFALPLLMRVRGLGLGALFLGALGWVTLSGLLIDTNALAYQTVFGHFSINPILRLGDFVLGMAAAKAMLDNKEFCQRHVNKVPWIIASVVLYQALTPELQADTPWFATLRLAYVLLICAVGVGFVAPGAPSTPSKTRSFLILLGEASYGLYLIQSVVADSLRVFALRFLHIPQDRWISWPGFTLMLVCAVAASIAMHKFFETPVRLAIQKRLS